MGKILKIKKYSKSFNDILKIKKSFFQENETNLKNILKINNFYKKQPPRKTCKNCNYKIIKKNFIFNNFNIDYYICNKCGHLNGKHEDSKKFSYWLKWIERDKLIEKKYTGIYCIAISKLIEKG